MPLSVFFSGDTTLVTKVQVHSNLASILCLQTEAVDDVTLVLLIYVLCSDDFFNLLDADSASEEEGVDLITQRTARTPCVNFELMITGLKREANESIAFYAVSAPVVH